MAYLWMLLAIGTLALATGAAQLRQEMLLRQDHERELLAIGRQFASALCRYHQIPDAYGQHQYPPSLDELLRDNRVPGVRRHLRRIFIDPMTGHAEWGLVRVAGRIVAVHSLSPRRPLRQAGREGNMDFTERQSYREWIFSCARNIPAW